MKAKSLILGIVAVLMFLVTIAGALALDWKIAGGSVGNYSGTQGFADFTYQYAVNESNLPFVVGAGCGPTAYVYSPNPASCALPTLANRTDFGPFTNGGFLWWHPVASGGAMIKFTAPTTGTYNYNASFYKWTGGNNVDFYIKKNGYSGTSLNSTTLAGGTTAHFRGEVSLNAGETLVFYNYDTDGTSGDSAGVMLNITSSPSVASNFTITATDQYTGGALTNFSATVDGDDYSTSTGTITTNLLQNATSLYDVEVWGANNTKGAFFNKTYSNYNVSSNLNASLYQAEITGFNAFQKVTNSSLGGIVRNSTGTVTAPLYIDAGLYNFTFQNSTHFNKTQEFTVPALYNGTLNFTGLYQSNFTVNVTNAYSGAYLSNFTGWAYHNATGYNETFSTTTGGVILNLINGDWTLFVDNPNYAINETTNWKYPVVSSWAQNQTFALYSNNSVRISIYDVTTATLITQNMSITVTGNASEDTYYTTTGQYFLDGLLDGAYTFKFVDVAGNYSQATYVVTVADRSTQTLNAYLTANAQQVIFTFLNSLDGTEIEGASVSQSKLIGSSYVLIESKETDITGRVLFSYLAGSKYRFTASKSGYSSKIFDLDPILFSSYNVKLDPIVGQNNTIGYSGVVIEYTPKKFQDDANNSMIFLIKNPGGSLSNYWVNVSFNGNYADAMGTNAYGEEFNLTLEVLNASIYDKVRLDFYYSTSLGVEHDFTYYLPITGVTSDTVGTFISNLENDYGLGWFERVLIATGIIIIVAGMVYLIAGATVSLVIGSLLMGYMTYIGFIPLWGLVIAGFVALILLSRNPGVSYG